MKKTNIIFSTLICTSLFIASCQQEKAVDPELMDAKVKEAYEAKITEIDAEATAACEAKINEKVQSLKDSLSHVSAAQQAALMAKMQKDLEIAKKKAQEVAKKKGVSPSKQGSSSKPISEDERIKKAQEELLKNQGKQIVTKSDEEIKKAQDELLKNKGQTKIDKTDDEVKKAQDELLRKLKGGN